PHPLPAVPYPFDEFALDHLARARELGSDQVQQVEAAYPELAKGLQERRDDFDVKARDRSTREKVVLALQRGLGKTAMEILGQASNDEIGPDEGRLLLYLLLFTGRGEQIPAQTPETQALLGSEAHWFNALRAASLGNYSEAIGDLKSFSDQ